VSGWRHASRFPHPMRIHRLQGLAAYSYLLETPDDLFLIDAGTPRHAHAILGKIHEIGRAPADIRLAIVTHGHADHFGGLAHVQEVAGGFPVIAHPAHVSAVSTGAVLVSPGLNPFSKIYELLAVRYLSAVGLRGVREVLPAPDDMTLDEFGLAGRIVHTPGHSTGDITLLLDDGSAFVGDTIQGRRIPRLTPPELPNMALDVAALLGSWTDLLERGATRFFPAHGSTVTAEEIRPVLARALRRHAVDAVGGTRPGAA